MWNARHILPNKDFHLLFLASTKEVMSAEKVNFHWWVYWVRVYYVHSLQESLLETYRGIIAVHINKPSDNVVYTNWQILTWLSI